MWCLQWHGALTDWIYTTMLTIVLVDGVIHPPPTKTLSVWIHSVWWSRPQGWGQSAHLFAFMSKMLSKFLHPPLPRVLPFLEDLPVHAVSIHFRHIVSTSCCQMASWYHRQGREYFLGAVDGNISTEKKVCQFFHVWSQAVSDCIAMSTVTLKALEAGICVWPSNRHYCWRVTSWWVHILKEMTNRGPLIWIRSYQIVS